MEQTKRITYIDAAKGLGIVLIVFGHIASNDALRQYIYSFHVPVFFFLSGMTYRLKEDLAGTWKKRMSRLYLPYLIFSLISILLFCLMGKMAASRLQVNLVDGNIGSYLAGMLYANSRTGYMKWNTPLWFIPCLLATYLIADVIEMAVRKAARGGI